MRIGAVPYRGSEQRTVLNFSLLSHKAPYSGGIINVNSAQCPRQSVNPIVNFVHSCHAEVMTELFFHRTIKKLLHPLLPHWYFLLLLPFQQKKTSEHHSENSHLALTLLCFWIKPETTEAIICSWRLFLGAGASLSEGIIHAAYKELSALMKHKKLKRSSSFPEIHLGAELAQVHLTKDTHRLCAAQTPAADTWLRQHCSAPGNQAPCKQRGLPRA